MKKLLLLEDDPDTTYIVEMALAGKYEVFLQKDSANITITILSCMPDVILIDYYIGQQHASEIIKEIHLSTKCSNIPFILFSGHYDIERIAKEMGATSFLSKPFRLADLYLTIAQVLAMRVE
jgi:DNA-binding NtrC family response regulator